MKRSTNVKFPNSVQLFKFCQKVLQNQKGGKVRDQEVGSILSFNPSDCSHWKRGEKNVKSVFALAKLADSLQVEPSLIHDVASGMVTLDEVYFEYQESLANRQIFTSVLESDAKAIGETRERITSFIETIHAQCEFVTPPLYLPEVMRVFSYISSQSNEMIDKLSRILRIRPGQYCIHYQKGELKPQTRMSMVKDLSRIVLEGERARYPELGPMKPELVGLESIFFVANLLVPKQMLLKEMSKMDARRNVVSELSALFWAPKSVVCFQLQDLVREGSSLDARRRQEAASSSVGEASLGRGASI